MKKKIVIACCIIALIVAIVLVTVYKINNHKTLEFRDLIKFKTESIMNEKQLSKILDNLEMGQYIINTEKESLDGKENLRIYFDCTDENEILNYYRTYHKISPVEKNAVILFALVNNLDELTMNFTVSNIQFAKEHHMAIIEDKFDSTEITYTREMIEKNYNQDVRNFVDNPDEFMNYNIDLNVENITIYYKDYSNPENSNEIKVINVNEREKVEKIVQYFKEQKIETLDYGYNESMIHAWVDFNNGFIIEIFYGNDNYGAIIKGNGKEIFSSENPSIYLNSNRVYKKLPQGLTEYAEKCIEEKS